MTGLSVACALGLALAATALTTAAAPPLAATSDRPVSVAVSYADLDINRLQDAQALYRRIVAAAGQVCADAPAARAADRRRAYDACRAEAVFQAVTEVSAPTSGAATLGATVRVQVSGG
jgi:UrcA family protein